MYPSGDLDEPATILSYLGTFWSSLYGGRDQLLVYAQGLGLAMRELDQTVAETVACLNITTVPVWHRTAWQTVTLDVVTLLNTAAPLTYGANFDYGGGLDYGGANPPTPLTAIPVSGPADLPILVDAVANSTVTLCAGLDYTYDGATLTFAVNPATSGQWTPTLTLTPQQTIGAGEITCWGYRSGFDRQYATNAFGLALGLNRPSSLAYNAVLQALWAGLTKGSSYTVFARLVSAITGAALAREDGEVVEVVTRDNHGLLVVTDRHVYRGSSLASAVVAVGDILDAGDPLTDAVEVFELNQGSSVIPSGTFPVLALTPGFLASGFLADLLVEDVDYPLTLTVDQRNRPAVRFPIRGFPGDVAEFWRRVDTAGNAPGSRTLAELLDLRGASALTPPTAASLPATINPLRFVVDQVLRGQAILLRIRAGALPQGPAGLADIGLLRRVLDPAMLLLMVIDMSPQSESTPTNAGDSLSSFASTVILSEPQLTPTDYLAPPRILSRSCQ